MSESEKTLLSADDVYRIAGLAPRLPPASCVCETLRCPGWESLSGGFDESALHRVGGLPLAADAGDATLDEFHPAGTGYWSADAPIALGWFPYNRCAVWQCRACGRAFLRYTEFGGYYVDPRIRELDPSLIVAGVAVERG